MPGPSRSPVSTHLRRPGRPGRRWVSWRGRQAVVGGGGGVEGGEPAQDAVQPRHVPLGCRVAQDPGAVRVAAVLEAGETLYPAIRTLTLYAHTRRERKQRGREGGGEGGRRKEKE